MHSLFWLYFQKTTESTKPKKWNIFLDLEIDNILYFTANANLYCVITQINKSDKINGKNYFGLFTMCLNYFCSYLDAILFSQHFLYEISSQLLAKLLTLGLKDQNCYSIKL